MAQRTKSDRILLVIGVVVALLMVVAVVFAIQPPTEFDPTTPEGTAQGYFRAINDGNQQDAESFMTDELRAACQWEWWFHDGGQTSRVVITDTGITGETARVEVTIDVSYGNEPFGGGTYDTEEAMIMIHQDGIWLISEPVWPMDPYACGDGDR